MNQPGLTISRRSACVRLTGDPDTLAWVRKRGSAYFDFADDATDPSCWQIIAGREHAPDVSFFMRGSSAGGPDGCDYWLNPKSRAIVIDVARGSLRDLWGLRMVRHLLRWQLFHAGAIFLHGSVIAHAGGGIALLGQSRAGKTTVLLQSLRLGGVAFVGEDDLTIVQQPDGRLVALGWPGCIRVRRSMLRLFPEFARTEQFQHPANSQEAKLGPDAGLLRIFPEELGTALGCDLLPEVHLQTAVWLEWAERTQCIRMVTDEIHAALDASWIFFRSADQVPGRGLYTGGCPDGGSFASIPFCMIYLACLSLPHIPTHSGGSHTRSAAIAWITQVMRA